MDRKALVTEWKERKQDAGIYLLRFRAGAWIGAAPRLAAAENRHRFTLSNGMERNPALAAAWAAEGDFGFEVVEALDPELSQMTRQRLLKERLEHWLATLGAAAV